MRNRSWMVQARKLGGRSIRVAIALSLALAWTTGCTAKPTAPPELVAADSEYHLDVLAALNEWRDALKRVNAVKQAAVGKGDLSTYAQGLTAEAVDDWKAVRRLGTVRAPSHHEESHDRLVNNLQRVVTLYAELTSLTLRSDWYRAGPVADRLIQAASDISDVLDTQRAEDAGVGITEYPLASEARSFAEVESETTTPVEPAPADGKTMTAYVCAPKNLVFPDKQDPRIAVASRYCERVFERTNIEPNGIDVEGLIMSFTAEENGLGFFTAVSGGKDVSIPAALVSYDGRWYIESVYKDTEARSAIDELLDQLESEGNESYRRGGELVGGETYPWQPPE